MSIDNFVDEVCQIIIIYVSAYFGGYLQKLITFIDRLNKTFKEAFPLNWKQLSLADYDIKLHIISIIIKIGKVNWGTSVHLIFKDISHRLIDTAGSQDWLYL